jgi:soluble lytic murein transglycosylase-like protein
MTIDEIKQAVVNYANGYGIYPEIALAQLDRESNHFDPMVVFGPKTGTSGERGIGQFMSGTWDRFAPAGIGFDQAFDIDYNLTAWGNYLSWLLNRYGGDYTKALMGYNGGEGHVDQGNVSSAARNYASAIIAKAQGLDVPDDASSPDNPNNNPDSNSNVLLIGASVLTLVIVFSLFNHNN